MIDLSQSAAATSHVHSIDTDPGRSWMKDPATAIDAPPDDDLNPLPEARWPSDSRRTGICGAVSPRVVAFPGGGLRMYYTQILPRRGFPAGANDYENATARILSAFSADGSHWTPEPGVRLSAEQGGAGEFRVASSEVAPVGDSDRLRMYYECCPGSQSITNSIRSAISLDGGIEWTPEPGARFESPGCNYASPRIAFLDGGGCRLYVYERGRGIISALSDDGLEFHREAGVRIAEDGLWDTCSAFAPEIVRVAGTGYVMYYAGYSRPNRAYILRAISDDGLTWRKEPDPVISPGPGGWDAAKCSEMCLVRLLNPNGGSPRFRMFYEAATALRSTSAASGGSPAQHPRSAALQGRTFDDSEEPS
jgi:hypothetical protein